MNDRLSSLLKKSAQIEKDINELKKDCTSLKKPLKDVHKVFQDEEDKRLLKEKEKENRNKGKKTDDDKKEDIVKKETKKEHKDKKEGETGKDGKNENEEEAINKPKNVVHIVTRPIVKAVDKDDENVKSTKEGPKHESTTKASHTSGEGIDKDKPKKDVPKLVRTSTKDLKDGKDKPDKPTDGSQTERNIRAPPNPKIVPKVSAREGDKEKKDGSKTERPGHKPDKLEKPAAPTKDKHQEKVVVKPDKPSTVGKVVDKDKKVVKQATDKGDANNKKIPPKKEAKQDKVKDDKIKSADRKQPSKEKIGDSENPAIKKAVSTSIPKAEENTQSEQTKGSENALDTLQHDEHLGSEDYGDDPNAVIAKEGNNLGSEEQTQAEGHSLPILEEEISAVQKEDEQDVIEGHAERQSYNSDDVVDKEAEDHDESKSQNSRKADIETDELAVHESSKNNGSKSVVAANSISLSNKSSRRPSAKHSSKEDFKQDKLREDLQAIAVLGSKRSIGQETNGAKESSEVKEGEPQLSDSENNIEDTNANPEIERPKVSIMSPEIDIIPEEDENPDSPDQNHVAVSSKAAKHVVQQISSFPNPESTTSKIDVLKKPATSSENKHELDKSINAEEFTKGIDHIDVHTGSKSLLSSEALEKIDSEMDLFSHPGEVEKPHHDIETLLDYDSELDNNAVLEDNAIVEGDLDTEHKENSTIKDKSSNNLLETGLIAADQKSFKKKGKETEESVKNTIGETGKDPSFDFSDEDALADANVPEEAQIALPPDQNEGNPFNFLLGKVGKYLYLT